MAPVSSNPPISLCRQQVVSVQLQEDPAASVFANQTKLLLSRRRAKNTKTPDYRELKNKSPLHRALRPNAMQAAIVTPLASSERFLRRSHTISGIK